MPRSLQVEGEVVEYVRDPWNILNAVCLLPVTIWDEAQVTGFLPPGLRFFPDLKRLKQVRLCREQTALPPLPHHVALM